MAPSTTRREWVTNRPSAARPWEHPSGRAPTPLDIQSHPPGFTFVEVVVVAGLLALLTLMALPQLAVPDAAQVAQVARQIATDLRRAQELSIATRNVCCTGAPCFSADSYYTLQFNPGAAPYTSYTLYKSCDATQVEPDFPKTIPSGITVSGRQTFCWHTGGYIVDICLTGTTGTDGSVTVSAGTASATVWVYWYNGRVKVVGP